MKRGLEVASAVATLLAGLLVLGGFLAGYLFPIQRNPQLTIGLVVGHTLPALRSIKLDQSGNTLVVAMATDCATCMEDLGFYRKLVGEKLDRERSFRFIALWREPERRVSFFLGEGTRDLPFIANVDLGLLGITAVPTAVLLDNRGTILDFWIGKLSKDTQSQITRAIATPPAASAGNPARDPLGIMTVPLPFVDYTSLGTSVYLRSVCALDAARRRSRQQNLCLPDEIG
jgi:hypothetical protein